GAGPPGAAVKGGPDPAASAPARPRRGEVPRSAGGEGVPPRARPPAASAASHAPPAVATPRFDAPRVDTPRGVTRAALAPSNEPVARPSEAQPSPPALAVARFEDLIVLAAQKRDLAVKLALERDVRLVRCEDARLEIALQPT